MKKIIKNFPMISLLLGCVIAAALALRLYGVSFGLPAMYDPDEPVFMLLGLGLVRGHTLNPHWFGHPGTTTIYTLACIDLLVYIGGHVLGCFANPAAFALALYANPTIVFLPGRLFIVACGVACVFLTFLIGRRLFDDRTGLIAATVLALNPLHIQYSQIIRTDMHASVFMLLCILCSINIVRRGRMFDYIASGILVGVACATKWPAAAVMVCPLSACIFKIGIDRPDRRRLVGHLAVIGAASILSLIIVSPYLVLDFHTVVFDLKGEGRPHHPGATGGSLFANLFWYLSHPLRESLGLLGLALAFIGIAFTSMRNRPASVVLFPVVIVFGLFISAQALIWARWVVPLLPFFALFIAVGLCGVVQYVAKSYGKRTAVFAQSGIFLGLVMPMLLTVQAQARELLNDTRDLASAWIHQHVPAGSTIVVEHLSADIWRGNWKFRFPAGGAGCVDTAAALKGQVRFSSVDKWQNGRSVVDLGTMDPAKLVTCRAQYAIITHYDRYLAERSVYPGEAANYEDLFKGGVPLVTFFPKAGEIGGPVTRIVKLGPRLDSPIRPH
jgi:hypothetical protein